MIFLNLNTMAFKAQEQRIGELLGRRVYSIPRNQRRYVWTDDNWNELIADIQFSIKSNKPHFLGSIVLKIDDDKGDISAFTVIDGQQRTITILLFLTAIMQVFKDRADQQRFEGQKSYLLTTDLSNSSRCKVLSDEYVKFAEIIEEVCKWESSYDSIDLLLGSDSSESSIEIKRCISFFYNKCLELGLQESLLIRDALLGAKYVEIIATTEEDSYTVFEILNARGQPLENHELLKNFIMRYTLPVRNVDRVKIQWDSELAKGLGKYLGQFIKHYVVHKYKKDGKRTDYEIIKHNTPTAYVDQLFKDLLCKASYYRKIVMLDNKSAYSDVEYYVFKYLFSKKGILFRPLLMSLMHQKDLKQISIKQYEAMLYFILHFFVCYNLLGKETSNKISDLVQNFSYKIEMSFGYDVVKDLLADLIEKLPNRGDFINNFVLIGWSHSYDFYKDSSNKRRVKVALETIERIKTGKAIEDDFTIEHILPDAQEQSNARIGNLIPLEANLNANCKDKDFRNKLQYYKKSSYLTARNISERFSDSTVQFKPEERGKIMAGEVYDAIDEMKKMCLALFQNVV